LETDDLRHSALLGGHPSAETHYMLRYMVHLRLTVLYRLDRCFGDKQRVDSDVMSYILTNSRSYNRTEEVDLKCPKGQQRVTE
ncbi:hypothetical protein Tco_0089195, partial [Tanacetum coccineum]